jgi:hypothetical protein
MCPEIEVTPIYYRKGIWLVYRMMQNGEKTAPSAMSYPLSDVNISALSALGEPKSFLIIITGANCRKEKS